MIGNIKFFKKNKYLLLVISLLTLQNTIAATPQETVLNIEKWQTKNGVAVYYAHLPELPIVDIDVLFNAGSAQDNKNYGVASLTSNMIGQSAKNLSADEIAEQFDDVAAVFDTETTRDFTTIHLRSLTRQGLLTPALKTYTTVINDPNFTSKSFKRVKEQTLQAILQQQQTPSDIADKALFKTIYNAYPYGHPRIGNLETIKVLTPEDLLQFYQKYYVARNASIIIVGNVSKAKAQQIANQVVGQLPKGKPSSQLEKPQYAPINRDVHINYPASQTFIRLGELGISRRNKDYFPLYVGNYILGGGILTSRLFKEIRQRRGLTYGVYSFFIPYKQAGPFIISLQTRNQKANEAIKVIKDQVTTYLKKGPSIPELTLAKQNIIGGFPLRLDSNNAILNQVTNIAAYKLPLNYLDTYRANIDKVTLDDIKKAFNKHINIYNMVTVTVGPEEQSNEQQSS